MSGVSAVSQNHPDAGVPWNWSQEVLGTLAATIRAGLFPISVAANKADCSEKSSWEDLTKLVENSGGVLVPTSAEAELALRRASLAKLIELDPNTSEFEITKTGQEKLSEAQRTALTSISETLSQWDGGGLIGLLSTVVFDRLSHRVAYPVQDDTHWIDGEGNILPDALLVPEGTTAKGLAYAVHSDLGDGFIRATDARSGRVIGADYEIQNGDIISIHAKK